MILADRPPSQRLALTPHCRNVADVELALRELSWIEWRAASIRAAGEQRMQRLRLEIERELRYCLGGHELTCDERAADLRQAISRRVIEQREAIECAPGRTWQFECGSVQLRWKEWHQPWVEIAPVDWPSRRREGSGA